MTSHKSDDDFANKIVQQLDASITGLDEDIKQSLSASRKAAITKAARVSNQPFFNFNWQQIGMSQRARMAMRTTAFAGALILIVTVSITLFPTSSSTLLGNEHIVFLPADYDVTDDAVIAEYELLNDLEFISWLVEEDNAS